MLLGECLTVGQYILQRVEVSWRPGWDAGQGRVTPQVQALIQHNAGVVFTHTQIETTEICFSVKFTVFLVTDFQASVSE